MAAPDRRAEGGTGAATLRLGPPGDRHRFCLHGRRFWVHGPSGAVYEMSPAAWDALVAAEDLAQPPDWAAPTAAVAARLAARWPQHVAQAALDEVHAMAQAAQEGAPPACPPPGAGPLPLALQGLILHVAHACNLRCTYCFAGQGTYGSPAALMDPEVARRAVDFLLAHAAPVGSLALEFFGGEPLLNRRAIAAAAARARELEAQTGRPFHLTLSTNGTVLDAAAADLIRRYRIDTVVSLDGRPAVHDAARPGPGGSPSHAAALAGLRRVLALPDRPRCYVRAVFTRHSAAFVDEVLYLLGLAVDGMGLEPAVGCGQPWSLDETALAQAEAAYQRLAWVLAHGPDRDAARFLPFQIPSAPPSPWDTGRGCGAGVSELAVAPDGGLYPCHRFVGDPAFCLGSVHGGVTRPDLVAAFAGATAATKPACRTCWARAWCGGGCHANGYAAHGSILATDEAECRLRKKRLECAFWLAAEQWGPPPGAPQAPGAPLPPGTQA